MMKLCLAAALSAATHLVSAQASNAWAAGAKTTNVVVFTNKRILTNEDDTSGDTAAKAFPIAVIADAANGDINKADENAKEIKWSIYATSYRNLDTGEEIMELTNEIVAPIQASDEVTFHVEFTPSGYTQIGQFRRDAFECKAVR